MVYHERPDNWYAHASQEGREPLRYPLNAGTSRFIASAQENHVAGWRFFNPNSVFSPPEIAEAVRSASHQQIDFSPINDISNYQRNEAWRQYTTVGISSEEQRNQWAQSMVAYFRNYFQYAPDEVTQLLQDRLGIYIKADDTTLWTNMNHVWEKYLGEGSKIELFFQDLSADLTTAGPFEAAELIKRVHIITPLLGMFGNAETQILAYDAAIAAADMELMPTDVLIQEAQANFQEFTDDNQRNAYRLLWNSLRQKVAQQSDMQDDAHVADNPVPEEPLRRNPPPVEPDMPPPHQQHEQPPQHPQPDESAFPDQSEEHEQPQQNEASEDEHEVHQAPVEMHEAEPLEESDSVPEHLILEERVRKAGPYEWATFNMKDPEHPDFGADRVLALPIAGGDSIMFAAIDGKGAGQRYSSFAAEIVRDELARLPQIFQHKPTVEEGVEVVSLALKKAAQRIESLQSQLRIQLRDNDTTKKMIQEVGAVAATGIICSGKDGKDVLLTINLGDCRIYAYNPTTAQSFTRVTTDHSLADRLRATGVIQNEDEAFFHDGRNQVYREVNTKSVDDLIDRISNHDAQNDMYHLYQIPPHSDVLFLAVTDGWTDNSPPEYEKDDISDAWQQSVSGTKKKKIIDVSHFVKNLGTRIYKRFYANANPDENQRPRYKNNLYVKLDDVGIVAVYRRAG